ncbi:hypothetical protein BRC68_13345 [Halobacteriales archaeon QH_6_64_20]|nr:MAG: hypothetical protein BRC68_13345 [Halobacteriales archaeon QH_6_64_20]
MATNGRTIRTGMVRLLLSVLGIAIGSGLVSAHPGTNDRWHHMGPGSWMGGSLGWLWMVIWMLVPIALIVGLVYLLRPRGTTAGSEPTDHALETLREQYARGEIDDEEYETRRERLS